MAGDVFDDIGKLRLSSGTYTEPGAQAPPRNKPGKRRADGAGFVRVPVMWKERLMKSRSVIAHKLALELLFESWRTEDPTLILSNAMAKRAGVDRWSKSRGLHELERLGLVTVEWPHPGSKRCPCVTLRGLPY